MSFSSASTELELELELLDELLELEELSSTPGLMLELLDELLEDDSMPSRTLGSSVSIPLGTPVELISKLVLSVVLNCPDCRYNFLSPLPHHGVSVPSNDMPVASPSTPPTSWLSFIVLVNRPDWRYNLASALPAHGVLFLSADIP